MIYTTGLLLEQALALQPEDIHFEQRQIWIRSQQRSIPLPSPLAESLQQGIPLPHSPTEGEAILADYAQKSGLHQRFAAMGRSYDSHSLRTAYAVHSLNNGMREITLMNQLGLKYFVCVSTYMLCAVGRWLPHYQASHELTLNPDLFRLKTP